MRPLEALLAAVRPWRAAFAQKCSYLRAVRQALGLSACLGRRTLWRIIWSNGGQYRDWREDYFLRPRCRRNLSVALTKWSTLAGRTGPRVGLRFGCDGVKESRAVSLLPDADHEEGLGSFRFCWGWWESPLILMMIAPSTSLCRKAIAKGPSALIAPAVKVDVGDERGRAMLVASPQRRDLVPACPGGLAALLRAGEVHSRSGAPQRGSRPEKDHPLLWRPLAQGSLPGGEPPERRVLKRSPGGPADRGFWCIHLPALRGLSHAALLTPGSLPLTWSYQLPSLRDGCVSCAVAGPVTWSNKPTVRRGAADLRARRTCLRAGPRAAC